jgi:hypothetical protein
MPTGTPVDAVAHVIQLAVAPVFLLSGIGAMLAVMTQRLSRVIDRARLLEAKLLAGSADEKTLHAQLATLSRRAKLVSRSITLCTATALLVCAVIAVLFLGASLGFDASVQSSRSSSQRCWHSSWACSSSCARSCSPPRACASGRVSVRAKQGRSHDSRTSNRDLSRA